jgi:hypothetical protein
VEAEISFFFEKWRFLHRKGREMPGQAGHDSIEGEYANIGVEKRNAPCFRGATFAVYF